MTIGGVSSLNNPILNDMRNALAEHEGLTIEALAYEAQSGCLEVLNYGYSVEDTYGYVGTRDDAISALKVCRRILRIEEANK